MDFFHILPSVLFFPAKFLSKSNHPAKRYSMLDKTWSLNIPCQWKWQTHFALLQEMSSFVTCFLLPKYGSMVYPGNLGRKWGLSTAMSHPPSESQSASYSQISLAKTL